MRAWLVTACLSLCALSCVESATDQRSSSGSAGAASSSDASTSAKSTAPGLGGGGQPSVAASALAPPSGAPSAAASAALVVHAEPIPRGLVATDLAAKPPGPARGKPRGPIDTAQDGAWLRRMSHAAITKASQNKGGSTVTIRVYFEDGYRAVFKGDQARSATNYRSEIVAYHLDRLLGCGRTAPVVGRRINRAALRQLLLASRTDPDFMRRFDDELRDAPADSGKAAGPGADQRGDGVRGAGEGSEVRGASSAGEGSEVRGAGSAGKGSEVRGALIAWHEKPLHSLPVPRGWTKWLAAGAEVPEAMQPHLPALAELTLFDYLLDNTDRWSGGNVLLLGDKGPLIFLDNGAGFAAWRVQKELRLDADLAAVCEFPSGILRNLEALGPSRPEAERLSARLERSLRRDPLAPVLNAVHLKAIDQRLELVLAHVATCQARRLGRPAASAASPATNSSAAPKGSAASKGSAAPNSSAAP